MTSGLERIQTTFDTSEGKLDRPASLRGWRVLEGAALQDRRLVWNLYADAPWVKPSMNIFEGFLGLEQATDQEILRFSRRWGPLGLCEHDFPMLHGKNPWPGGERLLDTRCFYREAKGNLIWEPIDAWRHWAARAKATLTVASRLYDGRIGAEADWRVVRGAGHKHCDDRGWAMPINQTQAWERLEEYINAWIALSRVRVIFEACNGKPRITLGSWQGLFVSIAMQLALSVARTDGLAVCAGCGVAFIARRKPRTDRRNYCDDCQRRRVSGRDAQRACRQRRREATLQAQVRSDTSALGDGGV